jgi:NitT/TauT family transport system permease protein
MTSDGPLSGSAVPAPAVSIAAGGTAIVRAGPPAARAEDRRLVAVLQILTGAIVLGVWELAIAAEAIEPLIFSSPTRIGERIVSMLAGEIVYGRTIYDHIATTFQQIAIGYVLGASSGVLIGYLFGRVRFLRMIFEPIILALFSIPKIALAPLFVLVLGIGLWSKVGIVFIEVFFIVFFNTLKGVMDVNEEYVNIARIMGATRSQVLRSVVLPAALPSILMGLKMGVPFAIIGAILGEYIASNRGIGWYILYSSNSFDASGVWAGILFLVAISWLLSQVVNVVQARLLRWQPPRRGRAISVA